MKGCLYCGTPFDGPVYRTTVCPKCGREMHICKNCKFYNPSSHWECREVIEEYVQDKDRANFCSNFELGEITNNGENNRQKVTKVDLDKLFNI